MESNRQKKVARLIQKDLSDIFLQESKKYYQHVMITITHVFVSKDFSVAKVYLSLFPENKKLDVCGTRAIIKGSTRITPNRSYYLPIRTTLRIKNPFIHGSLIFKKTTIEKVNYYDERFFYSQDYKLVKDILHSGFSMGILKEPLYVLNLRNNISTNFKDKQKYYADCVRKNLEPNE